MTTIVQLSARVHNARGQLDVRLKIKYVSNLPALANISSASVFKPQLPKLACRVSVMWRSIDRLHSPMRTYSVLGYLVLEPYSPPTSAPYSHAVSSHIIEQTCTSWQSWLLIFSAKFIERDRAIKIDAASARSDCTGTLLLVLSILGSCKSIAQRIRVFSNLIDIRTNMGNKNKQLKRTGYLHSVNEYCLARSGITSLRWLKLQSMKFEIASSFQWHTYKMYIRDGIFFTTQK